MSESLIAIVPAAGVGSRAGQDALPKQYRPLGGLPMLRRAVLALLADARIAQVRVAVSPGDGWVEQALQGLPRTVWRPCGGPTRADTVAGALADAALEDDAWVLVHDAARPGLPAEALGRLIDACLGDEVGGLLALSVPDTVKAAQPGGQGAPHVRATVDREGLWLAQTPQMFRVGRLRQALAQARERGLAVTDEASAIEAQGLAPRLVTGSARNFKVTWPDDFALMEKMVMTIPFRIGQGFDVHALVTGRPLIIGGVCIEHTHGLLGHSDADVLLHAVTDAVLGAAGLGDIGRHFPDTDPRFKGADSRVLLREAMARVREAGWQVVNVDATVHAQAPKIGPHAAAMVANIAADLGVEPGAVNVKAKTNEGLGYLGRKEGIAATVAALIARAD